MEMKVLLIIVLYYSYLKRMFITDTSILNSGTLFGKAGTIIAAINFEMQDFDVDFINLKLEGLNGQLPNLDLHNLVVKLSHKQSIPTGYKMKSVERRGTKMQDNLMNLLSMMWTQSSGVSLKKGLTQEDHMINTIHVLDTKW